VGNKIKDNSATIGGGVFLLEYPAYIANNVFVANSASSSIYGGGALYVQDTHADAVNDTFAENSADNGYGDGILVTNPSLGTNTVTVVNSIFYNSTAGSSTGKAIDVQQSGAVSIGFCDAWNLGGPNDNGGWFYYPDDSNVTVGLGCINVNPKFNDSVDYRLKWDLPTLDFSPCIDQATNRQGTDKDGNLRSVDIENDYSPNYGLNAYCDMGAYELQEPAE
jgi:hypothetical protein